MISTEFTQEPPPQSPFEAEGHGCRVGTHIPLWVRVVEEEFWHNGEHTDWLTACSKLDRKLICTTIHPPVTPDKTSPDHHRFSHWQRPCDQRCGGDLANSPIARNGAG